MRLLECEVSQGHIYGSVVDETNAELREPVHGAVDYLINEG